MEKHGSASTHTQKTAGFGSGNAGDLGHAHTEATTPQPATTNEIDPEQRNQEMHGRETQQPTQISEAEGLKRLRDDGTADRR